jgi:hypothetical protein
VTSSLLGVKLRRHQLLTSSIGHQPPSILPRPQRPTRHSNLSIHPLHPPPHIIHPRPHPTPAPAARQRPQRLSRHHRRHPLDRPSQLRPLHRRPTPPALRPPQSRSRLSQGPTPGARTRAKTRLASLLRSGRDLLPSPMINPMTEPLRS